jgi:hypothetical protein
MCLRHKHTGWVPCWQGSMWIERDLPNTVVRVRQHGYGSDRDVSKNSFHQDIEPTCITSVLVYHKQICYTCPDGKFCSVATLDFVRFIIKYDDGFRCTIFHSVAYPQQSYDVMTPGPLTGDGVTVDIIPGNPEFVSSLAGIKCTIVMERQHDYSSLDFQTSASHGGDCIDIVCCYGYNRNNCSIRDNVV